MERLKMGKIMVYYILVIHFTSFKENCSGGKAREEYICRY